MFENIGMDKGKHTRRTDCMKVFIFITGIIFLFLGMEMVQRMQVLTFVRSLPLTNCD